MSLSSFTPPINSPPGERDARRYGSTAGGARLTHPDIVVPSSDVLLRYTPAPDACSVLGAARIKKAIEDYWAARGHSVEVKVIAGLALNARAYTVRQDIRSDMKNGLPKETA